MEKLFIAFETEPTPSDADDEQEVAKPLFASLVASLRQRGAAVLTAPSEWDAYGWYVEISVKTKKLTVMMQRSDSWLLMVMGHRSLFERLRGQSIQDELSELANLVADAVSDAFHITRPIVQTEAELRAA